MKTGELLTAMLLGAACAIPIRAELNGVSAVDACLEMDPVPNLRSRILDGKYQCGNIDEAAGGLQWGNSGCSDGFWRYAGLLTIQDRADAEDFMGKDENQQDLEGLRNADAERSSIDDLAESASCSDLEKRDLRDCKRKKKAWEKAKRGEGKWPNWKALFYGWYSDDADRKRDILEDAMDAYESDRESLLRMQSDFKKAYNDCIEAANAIESRTFGKPLQTFHDSVENFRLNPGIWIDKEGPTPMLKRMRARYQSMPIKKWIRSWEENVDSWESELKKMGQSVVKKTQKGKASDPIDRSDPRNRRN